MSTILITGGTGLIGKALTTMLLEKGHQLVILSRSIRKSTNSNVTYALWDVKQQTIDAIAISEADYIIHLAGAGVADKRWSEKRKKEIRESRTQSSALLVNALKNNINKVKAVISASATGWYGENGNQSSVKKQFTEEKPAAPDFLGETCRLWEASIEPVTELGIRLVKLRTGIVFSNDGGAFVEFIKPLKMGIAAVLGSGQQIISWIHIEDLCRIYLFVLENDEINGAYNAVAPMPVSNKVLMMLLAKKIKGKFFIPMHVPSFLLKIILGEMSIEVLKSASVSATKIKDAGFNFLYPSIEAATSELINK